LKQLQKERKAQAQKAAQQKPASEPAPEPQLNGASPEETKEHPAYSALAATDSR
jgi:hypothetical protein